MKIDFDGQVRTLDLQHVNLKPAMTIQDYLDGMAIFAWQEQLAGVGDLSAADVKELEAGDAPGPLQVLKTLKKMPMFTDPAWIKGMAAAHWLMLTQAGETPPPLDDNYDCDVLGFAVAFLTALGEDAKAKAVPDKPDPTARPARRAPSSRRTAPPKTPKTVKGEVLPLPRTGS